MNSVKTLSKESIAIVGIGCRFPKDVNTPSDFWELLSKGGDSSSEVPAFRWDSEKYYNPKQGIPNKAYTKRGSFLESVEQFDAQFFGISGRETVFMDPQQRLLLETSWEAIERSGLSIQELQKMNAGVYIGCMNYDYSQLVAEAEAVDLHATSGTTPSALSGRLAHAFGFQGTVLTLDTACSSSLLCIHLAIQSLYSGETKVALVGGVNLQLTPFTTVMDCAGKMLSPDGRCKTFSEEADGFGRGDACGTVLVMTLSEAQKRKLPIIALIHGSAVNHDGAAGAMTVPHGPAQQAVMKAALVSASLSPNDISYVEAHGTGTALGDPIEINAIAQIYGRERSKDNPLWVGSVKTNIGHSEAAAGIASVIKTALMLQHNKIAPHLHFEQPSKKIAWQDLNIRINQELISWPVNVSKNRLAGVSSFGLSGTNVHVILGAYEFPSSFSSEASVILPLCLSAHTKQALSDLVKRYIDYLSVAKDKDYPKIAYTTCAGRKHFNYRLALLSRTREEAIAQLLQLPTESEKLKAKKVLPQISGCAIYLPNNDFFEAYSSGNALLNAGIKPLLLIAESSGLLAAAVLTNAITLDEAKRLLPHLKNESALKTEILKLNLNKPELPIASSVNGQIFITDQPGDFISLFSVEKNQSILTLLDENDIFTLMVFGTNSSQAWLEKLPNTTKIYTISEQNNAVSQLFIDDLAMLHLDGYPILWSHLYDSPLERQILPTYPFQRETYWVKKEINSQWQFTKNWQNTEKKLEMGKFFQVPDTKDVHFQIDIDINSDNYWAKHKLNEKSILPGVFNIQVVMEFIRQFSSETPLDILKLTFHEAASIKPESQAVFYAVFTYISDNEWIFKSFWKDSSSSMNWILLASASLFPTDLINIPSAPIAISDIENHWKATVTGKELYQIHESLGYSLSQPFRWFSEKGWYAEGATLRELDLSIKNDVKDYDLYGLYPGLIDSCMQAFDSNGHESAMNAEDNKIYVPFHIHKISFYNNLTSQQAAWVYALMKNAKMEYVDSSIGDIVLFQDKQVIFKMEGLEYRKLALFSSNDKSSKDLVKLENFIIEENLSSFDYCLAVISHIMQIPSNQIDPEKTLNVMGLDSVMALEISSAIQERFHIEVPLVMLLESASIILLADFIQHAKSESENSLSEIEI